jgi:thiol-disulfide isomerase/thioredoxin
MRFLAILLLAALTARAQSNIVDPEAEPVLRAFAEFYRQAPAFTVDLKADTRLETEDMKQEFTTRATLAVKKPDKLAMTLRNSMIGSVILVSDGAAITTFMPGPNQYTVKPAPASLELMASEMGPASPASLPVIAALLERDPYAALVDRAVRIRYAGRETRGGVPCHRLAFTHEDYACDAWIRVGPQPLLEAIEPSLAGPDANGKPPAGLKAEATLTLSGWDLSTNLPDSRFTIELPPGARKMDVLIPRPGGTAAEDNGPDPDETLSAKPAPLFKLPVLDGAEFDLAARKDKTAVVLCFWTTWAGPCREALPLLAKLAAAYPANRVTVLAVNPQESEGVIRDYLKAEGLTLTVGLDPTGAVAGQYQVTGLPQVVIIDPAGLVRAVYMGFGQDLETDIRKHLDAMMRP